MFAEIPKLPPYEPETVGNSFDEEEDGDTMDSSNKPDIDSTLDEEEEERRSRREKKKRQLEPEITIVNPYETDQSSYFLPIAISIVAFIPLLYCICRL